MNKLIIFFALFAAVFASSNFLGKSELAVVQNPKISDKAIAFMLGMATSLRMFEKMPRLQNCTTEIKDLKQDFLKIQALFKNATIENVAKAFTLTGQVLSELTRKCGNSAEEIKDFSVEVWKVLINGTTYKNGLENIQKQMFAIMGEISKGQQSFTKGQAFGHILEIFFYGDMKALLLAIEKNWIQYTEGVNHGMLLASSQSSTFESVKDFFLGYMIAIRAAEKVPSGFQCSTTLSNLKGTGEQIIGLFKNASIENVAKAWELIGNTLATITTDCGKTIPEGRDFTKALLPYLYKKDKIMEGLGRLNNNITFVFTKIGETIQNIKDKKWTEAGLTAGTIDALYFYGPEAQQQLLSTAESFVKLSEGAELAQNEIIY